MPLPEVFRIGADMLGVIMLDTVFPRPVGDIGNPATFPFPTRYATVTSASPDHVVFRNAVGLTSRFIEAALQLQNEGCKAIVTSCGFLALQHHDIAARLSVPFASSSLCWLPTLYNVFGGPSNVGILTASARALTVEHIRRLGGHPLSPLEGVAEGTEFSRVILGNQPTGNMRQVGEDVVEAAERLVSRNPQTKAIVLECTNMPPYRDEIVRRTGRPTYDLLDLARNVLKVG
ncbi:aspartate/glutamate racemase family protein [Cupriavidus pinatubonensis]|nr:aspartate/glutamate racemase family protein [Cupriavidus pinatubonensis]